MKTKIHGSSRFGGHLLFLCMTAIILVFPEGTNAGSDVKDIPPGEALEIGKIVCTPEKSHDKKWFKCIECCQSINSYHLVSFITKPLFFPYHIFLFENMLMISFSWYLTHKPLNISLTEQGHRMQSRSEGKVLQWKGIEQRNSRADLRRNASRKYIFYHKCRRDPRFRQTHTQPKKTCNVLFTGLDRHDVFLWACKYTVDVTTFSCDLEGVFCRTLFLSKDSIWWPHVSLLSWEISESEEVWIG